MIDTEKSFESVKEKVFTVEKVMELSPKRVYRTLRQLVRFEYSLDYLLEDLASIMEDYIISTRFAEGDLYMIRRKELLRSLTRQRKVDLGEWKNTIDTALSDMDKQ